MSRLDDIILTHGFHVLGTNDDDTTDEADSIAKSEIKLLFLRLLSDSEGDINKYLKKMDEL